jgi:hypothetical protein
MAGFVACQKNTRVDNPSGCFIGHQPYFEGSAEPTEVSTDLLHACQSSNHEFSLIFTSNFGETVGVKGGGIVKNSNFVEINSQKFYPFSGQSYLFNLLDSSLFGNVVCFKPSNSLTQKCLRAPQPIQAKPLAYANNDGLDASKPQLIRWKRDTLNPAGQIFIQRTYYTDATSTKAITHIRMNLVNDSDEAFDILSQLPSGSKAIQVKLTRMNGMPVNLGSQTVFLNYRSHDSHFYEIAVEEE